MSSRSSCPSSRLSFLRVVLFFEFLLSGWALTWRHSSHPHVMRLAVVTLAGERTYDQNPARSYQSAKYPNRTPKLSVDYQPQFAAAASLWNCWLLDTVQAQSPLIPRRKKEKAKVETGMRRVGTSKAVLAANPVNSGSSSELLAMGLQQPCVGTNPSFILRQWLPTEH